MNAGVFLGLSYIIIFLQFCLLDFLPLTPLFSFSSFVVHFPGKCMSHTSSTYTFTTCRILHPSDELTSVSARYKSSKVIPQWTHDGVVYSQRGLLLRTPAQLSQFLISNDRSEISIPSMQQLLTRSETLLSDWPWQVKWWGGWSGVVSYGCHGQSRADPLNTHGWGRAWVCVSTAGVCQQ